MADYLNSAIAMRNRQRPLRKINASIRAGFLVAGRVIIRCPSIVVTR
jgi:hypothetical protein